MSNLWRILSLKAIDEFLHFLVCVGDSTMLAEVLGPRREHKNLDKAAGVHCVFKNLPLNCSVATALAAEVSYRGQKTLSIDRIDSIFDRNEHRTAVVADLARQYGIGQ
jgi:hypothetical protein